ncbi:MAG TPA: hypothetical protein VEK33_18425 [Terriglobales bacterium]|nr:hypothetical protein [Terriglobales bacterium]
MIRLILKRRVPRLPHLVLQARKRASQSCLFRTHTNPKVAFSVSTMVPSALSYSVGAPEEETYAARLNTRPARSPVNALAPPSRASPHDSGLKWVATSHSCYFFIHYTTPG